MSSDSTRRDFLTGTLATAGVLAAASGQQLAAQEKPEQHQHGSENKNTKGHTGHGSSNDRGRLTPNTVQWG